MACWWKACRCNAIADAVGTPCWVVSAGVAARQRLAALQAGDAAGLGAHIHYAVKANDHLAVLSPDGAGLGAGCGRGQRLGELQRALVAGIAAGRHRVLRRGQAAGRSC